MVKTEWANPNGGAPQGTLLGPVLFIVIINALSFESDTCKYVDNTDVWKLVLILNQIDYRRQQLVLVAGQTTLIWT